MMSLNEPVMQQWYNDIKTVRKMMLESGAPSCPACHMPFDKGKRRRLIDNCGHEICYSCVNSDHCPLCVIDVSTTTSDHHRRTSPDPTMQNVPLSLRPRLKTNGHFTTYMQARDGSRGSSEKTYYRDLPSFTNSSYPLDGSAYLVSPKLPRVPWQQRRHIRPSTVGVDSHSALSELAKQNNWPVQMLRHVSSLWNLDDDVPSQAARHDDPARTNMYMRLGLLLGDPSSSRPGSANQSSQESYASISSLASSEANTTNTSPLSTLTGSSDVEPLPPLGGRRGTSRDHSSDSVASLMSTSTSTGNSSSTSPIGTSFRRHMPARISDTFNPASKRSSSSTRRSNRGAGLYTLDAADGRGRTHSYKVSQIALQPLYFEVPQEEEEPLLLGRQWLFREIDQEINSDSETNKGIVIVGGPGSGKTAIIQQLLEYSCFAKKREDAIYHDVQSMDGTEYMSTSSSGSALYQSVANLHQEAARSLGSHVVACHFCQADNNVTCLVPEFVHSVAAMLCQSPRLAAYRDLLIKETRFQNLLSMASCVADASTAFVKGILEPLYSLRRLGKIPNTTCLMLVDGLNEAEFHRPDYGDTITAFLSRHIHSFPTWLKLVVTVRTSFLDVAKTLPFHHISLDRLSTNESLQRDVYNYILYRINSSQAIRSNITVNNNKIEGSSHSRFANHLAGLSKGCMLYVKLTLDLIEKGHLVVKSSSYRVLPVSLSEAYLLSFNLRFTTIKSYERVNPILQACLSSLYPMNPHEVFSSVNAGYVDQFLTWEDFLQRLETLTSAPILAVRKNNTVMFAHSSMREWLLRREENENPKFLCDARIGHAMIAFRLSRLEAPLDSERLLELGHHILKAHIYKNASRDLPQPFLPRDFQSLWVHLSTDDISNALGYLRNVYSPNVKVSRLLLLSGASPDCWVPQLGNIPFLCVAAYQGYTEMVALLLEFGANINVTADSNMAALTFACQQGHREIARLLLTQGAKINHVDSTGYCPLVHAAANGHLEVIVFLVQCDWPMDSKGDPGLKRAAQQALIVAAQRGHTNVCEFLLDMSEVHINAPDDLTRQTALTAACYAGQVRVCDVLLRRGASTSVCNQQREPPLACAAVEGHWEVAELLLNQKTPLELPDGYGRTALMLAAMEGHPVLELLLSKGASTDSTDKEGLTALCWACRKGQLQAAQCLIQHGSAINHTSKIGQTPLDFVASHGDPAVVQLLLDKGALVEHVDLKGVRPLDRAIGRGNTAAVARFLHKGAKLGSQTWSVAKGKPEICLLLLKKLLEDGAVLCNKGKLKEAVHRYQYSLKKFPEEEIHLDDIPQFQQLKHQLYVGMSRCKRKLKDHQAAVEAADLAISIRPKLFEGYYARARAKRELGLVDDARQDITEALRLAPQNHDIRKVLLRLKDDMQSGTLGQDISPLGINGNSESSDVMLGSTETIDQLCEYVQDMVADMTLHRTKESGGEEVL